MTVDRIHTYLFKPGVWRADGEYVDDADRAYPVEGESRITHGGSMWHHENRMRISGNEHDAFRNDYEIVPFREDRDFTHWTSCNSALGKFRGKFVLAGDAMLSLYRSEDGEYDGAECLLRISGICYRNWGTLFRGGDKLSSWTIRLNRV